MQQMKPFTSWAWKRLNLDNAVVIDIDHTGHCVNFRCADNDPVSYDNSLRMPSAIEGHIGQAGFVLGLKI